MPRKSSLLRMSASASSNSSVVKPGINHEETLAAPATDVSSLNTSQRYNILFARDPLSDKLIAE